MNVVLAAVLVLSCDASEYAPAETKILRDRTVWLERVSAAEARNLRRYAKAVDLGRAGGHRLIAYAGEELDFSYGDWRIGTVFLLETRGENGSEWWHLRESENGHLLFTHSLSLYGPVDRPRLPDVALVDRNVPLIRFAIGYHRLSAQTRITFLIDLRPKSFRVVAMHCLNYGATGVCGGPNHYFTPKRDLSCRWRSKASDFRCVSRETMNLRWTTRTATRTFWLLSDRSIPPSRANAATYPSGQAFADAVARDRDALKQRVVIDGIGLVEPIFDFSNDELFGATSLEPAMTARFFLLQRDRGRWIEIPATRLADERYAARRSKNEQDDPTTPGFTPEEPHVHFTAVELEPIVKRRRLIEVVATEGEGRTVYWVMVDYAASPIATGAIRLATTEAEHGTCEKHVRPPSATWLGVPWEDGLPGYIQAIPSQIEWEAGNEKTGQQACWRSGTIDWSAKQGWLVDLHEAPCTDRVRPPQAVTIGANGELGLRTVEP